MADTLTIVADTLRTMMGATAAEPYIKAIERNVAAAHVCSDGWICEEHPDTPWPHDDCAGPGMPCSICQPSGERPRLPSDYQSYAKTDHD